MKPKKKKKPNIMSQMTLAHAYTRSVNTIRNYGMPKKKKKKNRNKICLSTTFGHHCLPGWLVVRLSTVNLKTHLTSKSIGVIPAPSTSSAMPGVVKVVVDVVIPQKHTSHAIHSFHNRSHKYLHTRPSVYWWSL